MNQYDWSKPWDAGAQFSSICMYNSAFNLKLDDKLSDFINTKLIQILDLIFQKYQKVMRNNKWRNESNYKWVVGKIHNLIN